jgi:hypothetical protein
VDRTRVYSAACSVANLLLVIALSIVTWLITTRWLGIPGPWQRTLAVMIAFVGCAFVVQWWISIPVNLVLRRLIMRREDDDAMK